MQVGQTKLTLLALVDITEVPGCAKDVYNGLKEKPYVREVYRTFSSPHITALVEASDEKELEHIKGDINMIGYSPESAFTRIAYANVRIVDVGATRSKDK